MTQGMTHLSRAALLELILPVIAEESAISLSQLAKRLGVGRTTLYRHFSHRQSLLQAVAATAARQFVEAAGRADLTRGTGAEAVERLCAELFQLPEVLTMVFADNPLVTDNDLTAAAQDVGVEQSDGGDVDPFTIALRRGQADGSIDPAVPADWASMYAFLTLASGHLYVDASGAGRQEGLDLVLRAIGRTLFVDSPR